MSPELLEVVKRYVHRVIFCEAQASFLAASHSLQGGTKQICSFIKWPFFSFNFVYFTKQSHIIFQKPLDDPTLSFVFFRKSQVLILLVIKYIKKHLKKTGFKKSCNN